MPNSVQVGSTFAFQANSEDADDHLVAPNVPAAWSTDNEALATVDANGVLTALAEGSVQLTAAVDGLTPATIQVDLIGPAVKLAIVAAPAG